MVDDRSTGTKAMRFDPDNKDVSGLGGSSSSDGEEEGGGSG